MCYDKPIKEPGSDLVKSFKFKSIHEYSLWVNTIAPETPADPGTGTGGAAIAPALALAPSR